MSAAIEVLGVTKRYGNIIALDNVSFKVESGEMFGLIGPDGSGKSSLYRILATLSAPNEGSASICGLDTVRNYGKLRTIIGYMPEKFSLYQDLSILENLKFFASLFGVRIKDNYDLIAPVFSQLERFLNRRTGALSGGMKQKLALSCALIHKPEILLLDEPTTGVDAVSRNEFWNMLATLREKGITILVSTSYMDEATRCDRIAMIDKGKILDVNTPSGLVSNLNENLFNASSTDMFELLTMLRQMPEVVDCYTFGATLHVVGNVYFNPEEVKKRLSKAGLHNIRLYPAKGDIEDVFIKLTRDEKTD